MAMLKRTGRTNSVAPVPAVIVVGTLLLVAQGACGFIPSNIPFSTSRNFVCYPVRHPRAAFPTLIMKAAGSSDATNDDQDGEEKLAGSFFNKIPDGSAENNDFPAESEEEPPKASGISDDRNNESAGADSGADEFDRNLAEVLRRRQAKPKAASPSTIGGVPTSEVSGFAKKDKTDNKQPKSSNKYTDTSSSRASFVSIGPPDSKPLNDINNPEYDDQGYTLYADERTGEKKRVFEALVEYPCDFTMKIVGKNEGAFAEEIVGVVAESCDVSSEDIPYSERRNGKWSSVTVKAPVKSAEMLYMLYEKIDRDPRVKFKF